MTTTDTARTQDAGDNAPCQPINWKVLIRPLPPKETTAGGIVLPSDVVEAEQQLTCVAEVVRLGGLAFQAQTKAGLDLSREPNRPTAGSWVLCHQYAGQKIWVGDTEYRLMNDTEILAVTDDPEAFRNYV